MLAATPIADLFDPSGSISAGLRAYLEVGIRPFSVEFSFDSPRITLLDFDGNDNEPILSTVLGNGALALNIGSRSADRKFGNLNDIAEKITIIQLSDPLEPDVATDLLVGGFGVAEVRDLPTRIVANGGKGSDDIIMDSAIRIKATLSGGLGRDFLTGGALADILSGDEGADVLNGNGGIDTIRGGLGHDRLIGGAGGDTLDGGDGLDTVSYVTSTAGMTIDLQTMTLTGDGAGDVLISIERYEGTNFADTITGDNTSNALLSGLDGNDTIRGFNGNDLLMGGKGNDNLDGGAGHDMLIGAEGADVLTGGGGVDTVSYVTSKAPIIVNLATGIGTGGDAQGDVLSSIENLIGTALPFGDQEGLYDLRGRPILERTGDKLTGNDADNIISGLGGADKIDGGAGDDTLYGDAKDASAPLGNASDFEEDRLFGGLGNDTLFGQTGNDELDGGEGQDILNGGDGNDHLLTFDTSSIDVLDGGTGINRLSADYSDKTVPIIFIAGGNNDFTFADGDTQRNFQLVGELDTGNKNDQILIGADPSRNIIRTNGGSDLVYSGSGSDWIEGGDGNDRLFSGGQGDYVDGGRGNDFINGGSNKIKLIFNGFGEVVGFTQELDVPDELHGGAGIDTVSFEDLRQTVTYIGSGGDSGKQFGLGVSVDLLTNETGLAAIGIVMDGFENIVGTKYGDDLAGDDKNNVFTPLRGGGLSSGVTGGPDRIDGRGGIDTLVIDFSLADLADSQGVQTNSTSIFRLTTGNTATVDSYIYSNIERLHITGASKRDVLYSTSPLPGDDILSGLDGNDHLGGSGGSDTLLGGNGNDTITAQGTFDMSYNGTAGGRDVIDGGAGDDFIEDIAFPFGAPALGNDALFKLDGGTGFDTLSVDFSNQISAIVWNSATPSNFAFADGSYARNFEQLRLFVSGFGNDVITQLGRVNNQFYLGSGDDTVNAGLGNDTINGGDGNDLLVLDYSREDGANLSGLQGGGSSNVFSRSLLADGSWPDSLSYTNIERMDITGTSKDDNFSASDGDDTLAGGNGNDTINGLSGNDTIDGGTGNDIISGYAGNDAINGGAGIDTAVYIDKGQGVSTTLNGATVVSVFVGGVLEDRIRNVENIVGGSRDDTLTGDARDNAFSGRDGNDVLDGGGGADELSGGGGDDTFKVDNAADVVVETTFGGTDTVLTSVTYNLSAEQEIETLNVLDSLSTNVVNLTGNEFAQSIKGNDGANVINGGLGADTLSGLGGADVFVFKSLSGGVDTIQDFVSGVDSIHISAADFGGGLTAGGIVRLSATADVLAFAGSGAARFIYDNNGADAGIYFDATGGSGSDAVLFLRLSGLPSLAVSDILLI